MDFIIPWVDGNDPEWQKELAKYKNEEGKASTSYFRDWDNLQYWFRGVEQFAPWVDKIHFVTWGHIPEWLNTNHPKLNIVKHEDFIPKKYLPTFFASTIELNFNRIEGLSNEYVYFNDDMFLISPIKEEFFFKNGKICDHAHLNVVSGGSVFNKILFENLLVIGKYFSFYRSIYKKPFNWVNFKYGKANFKNLLLILASRGFPGFKNPHLAQPALKSTLEMLWEKEHSILDKTCNNRLRVFNTVNQYAQRYWELASNNFNPVTKRGKFFLLANEKIMNQAKNYIQNQKKPLICINDHNDITEKEFLTMKEEIKAAFESILPDKSTYEK